MSPELEQEALIMGNEGFLKTSGMAPNPDDLCKLLSGSVPNKLQPLMTAATKISRTRQILADVDKILGRAASGRPDSQDVTAEMGNVAACAFSDSEFEDLENFSVTKAICQAPQAHFQAVEGTEPVLDLENRSPLFEGKKLGKNPRDIGLESDGTCWPVADLSTGERAMGYGSCMVRDGGFLHAIENKMLFPPAASSLISLGQMSEFSAIMGRGRTPFLQNEHRPLSKMVESKKTRKILEQSQDQSAELCQSSSSISDSGGESTQKAEPEGLNFQVTDMPDLHLEISPGTTEATESKGENRLGGQANAPAHSVLSKDGKATGPEHDFDSNSVTSSLADHLASQILGEVDNFSWDLHSSCETDRQMDQLTTTKRPLLEALQAQRQSSPEEKSESERYSEDRKFYQHVLHMVKRSRGAEPAVPEPLEQQEEDSPEPSGLDLGMVQERAGEAETKPGQTATTCEARGPRSLSESQTCIIQNRQAELEPGPHSKLAENESRPHLSPEGDSKEVGSLDVIFVLYFSLALNTSGSEWYMASCHFIFTTVP